MSGRVFLDTNVLLYLLSDDGRKADRAEALLEERGTISVQVLNEFASIAIRKLNMTWADVGEVLATVRVFCDVEPLTVETHDHGRALAMRYGFGIYDAVLVAAALSAGATVLYSEDFQHGMRIDSRLTVRNPFLRASPEPFQQ